MLWRLDGQAASVAAVEPFRGTNLTGGRRRARTWYRLFITE